MKRSPVGWIVLAVACLTCVPARHSPRRVVLLLADTLRADHFTPERMPELWRYFEDGTRFEAAYSAATWTLPSVASLFTGRHPIELRTTEGTLISIPVGVPTLASELAGRGYATAAVTANVTVNHENGFSRGFDRFVAAFARKAGETKRQIRWPAPDADWVIRHAESALREFEGQDLFLYLHFMDPHDPYRDHETGVLLSAPTPGEVRSPEAVRDLRLAYASEVRFLDRRLAAFLEQHGPFDLVIFTSDHGEEFFEHGGFKHGPTVYPEAARVPLLIRGEAVDHRVISRPVSLVHLKEFLLHAGKESLDRRRAVFTESFSHGPPRLSRVFGERQAILFSRFFAAQATTPTARWLLDHHAPLVFATLNGDPASLAELPVDELLLDLIRHFAGFREGLYLLFPPGGPWRIEIEGAGSGGWYWGSAAVCRLRRSAAARLIMEIDDPDPFVLVFLPLMGESARLREATGGRWLQPSGGPPKRVPRSLAVWRDPGRPPQELAGIEETLDRLRALGYL